MAETTGQRGRTTTLWSRFKQLGPAFVLAAVVIGPGSLTLSTIAGNEYGYQLLWVPVVATIFMLAFTWMSARIGLVTGDTLLEAARKKYGKGVATVGGIFGFLALLAFQAGNNAGIGFATNALVGGSVRLWAVVFTLLAIAFVFLPELYEKVESLVKVIVAILVISFFGTVAIVGIDVNSAAAGLVPSFPDRSSVFLVIGIIASNFVIASAAYQSNLMGEKEWGPDQLTNESFDTLLGIGLIGLIIISVMLTSASVIGGAGSVSSVRDMARQLRPLAGAGAFYLFTFGFFFATLASIVVNALIGATLLVDGYGGDSSMESRSVRLWAVVMMLIGLGIVLVYKASPVEVLRTAQAMAIVAFPVLGFLILRLSSDEDVMGEYTNGRVVNIVGILGYLTIIAVVLNYIRSIIQFI